MFDIINGCINAPIPEIGKTYNCFDDGKIRETRRYEVIITDIVSVTDADKRIIDLWEERKIESPHLFYKETDVFIISKSFETDPPGEQIFARSCCGWFGLGDYFCSGRLDVDGTLNNKLNENRK